MDIRTKYYGRKTSRPLTPKAQNLYEDLYPTYAFSPQAEMGCDIVLEVGFGMGDFLAHQALLFPDKLFIGVEPFKTGIVSILKKIKQHNIQNIRLHHGVIYDILDQLPNLESAYILYPDPWPKKRHNKRRVVQVELLETLGKKIKPEGAINIASDHADYQEWIKDVISKNNACQFELSKIHQPFPDWIPTKYEKKAILEGRTPNYFHGVVGARLSK